ncbi:AbrB/MazE/SpoVT family DNA-binding domain-containing protein [Saccharopolyspora erythraea]|nr:AbrB/MazE/SpoVT family DNA-binding domain-containing protein [Saccharopolyspora erythraea]
MRSRLPLAEVATVPGDASWGYGIGRVDASGRIAENTVVRALGWAAGDHLSVSVRGGAAVVRRDPQGAFTIPSAGRVLLPAPVRTRVGVGAGDRLLLAADPAQDVVVAFPMWALDAVLAPHANSLVGGEQP